MRGLLSICRACQDSAMAVQSSRLVLNESMCTVTPIAIAASSILSHSGRTRTMLTPIVSHSVVTETVLTLGDMALCSWKSLMYGPSLGCDMSQACRRGEPFHPAPCSQQQKRGGRQYRKEHSGDSQPQRQGACHDQYSVLHGRSGLCRQDTLAPPVADEIVDSYGSGGKGLGYCHGKPDAGVAEQTGH